MNWEQDKKKIIVLGVIGLLAVIVLAYNFIGSGDSTSAEVQEINDKLAEQAPPPPPPADTGKPLPGIRGRINP